VFERAVLDAGLERQLEVGVDCALVTAELVVRRDVLEDRLARRSTTLLHTDTSQHTTTLKIVNHVRVEQY